MCGDVINEGNNKVASVTASSNQVNYGVRKDYIITMHAKKLRFSESLFVNKYLGSDIHLALKR